MAEGDKISTRPRLIMHDHSVEAGPFLMADLPVYVAFYVVPVIGALCRLLYLSQPPYELLWMAMLAMVFVPRRVSFSRKSYTLLKIILLLVALKYLLPILWHHNISFKALTIDFKWIFYLIYAVVWVNVFGMPDPKVIYRCGRNMAAGYAIFIILQILIRGGFSRSCSYLFEECNYVCYLMLIAFCFIRQEKGSRLDYLIFMAAAILSDSRTGIASATILLIYPRYRVSHHKPLYWLLLLLLLPVYIQVFFTDRGVETAEDTDRMTFLLQYIECVKASGPLTWLFGFFPGSPIIAPIVTEFGWHVHVFERLHSLTGLYPFYLHSTYLRMALVWGIPLVVYAIYRIIMLFRRTRNLTLKCLILLFLIESVSLSTLSLTNVSIMFYLAFISVYSPRRRPNRLTLRLWL